MNETKGAEGALSNAAIKSAITVDKSYFPVTEIYNKIKKQCVQMYYFQMFTKLEKKNDGTSNNSSLQYQ